MSIMAPAGMGKRGHLLPSGSVVKCFCALVVIAKRSVEELFMHYFYNLSSASGGFTPRPSVGLHLWTLLEDFRRSQTPNLPTLEKILRAPMMNIIRRRCGVAAIRLCDSSTKYIHLYSHKV